MNTMKQISGSQRIISVSRRLLLPNILIEALARCMGALADIVFFDKGAYAESRVRALLLNLKFGFNAKAVGRGLVLEGVSRIEVGSEVVLHHGVVIIAGPSGFCRIGAGSHISHYTTLAGSGGITIGEDTAISSGVAIYSASNQKIAGLPLPETPLRTAPVIVGDRVLIGANAMLMPGVTLEDDCAVGANAVVTKRVSSGDVAIGVPARLLEKKNG